MSKLSQIYIFLLFIMNSQNASCMSLDSKIYIAGHNGLVGSAIVRALNQQGYKNLIVRTSKELDLRNQTLVENFFSTEQPEYVFLAAAKVGGIKANMEFPAEFIYDNLAIQTNVIHSSYKYNVKKLLFLGSSCIYPRMCPQPIKEDYLLTQPLEQTNEYYAIAKIAGLKLCAAYNKQYKTNFISCMPTNLYGPNDNFDLETSHVLPALIAKFCEAKQKNLKAVTIWGSGSAKREFLHVDDFANAAIFLMNNYSNSIHINVGTGKDISIKDLAILIKQLINFEGDIIFDDTKPDGTPKKLLDINYMKSFGWTPNISLKKGLKNSIDWYLNKQKTDNSVFPIN